MLRWIHENISKLSQRSSSHTLLTRRRSSDGVHSRPRNGSTPLNQIGRYLSILFVFLGAISFVLTAPEMALAADWAATDNFESYAVGNLSGDNGGTGWSGAWVQATSGFNVVSSPVNSGTRSVQYTTAAADYNRSLTTGVTTGIFEFYMMADVSVAAIQGLTPIFRDGTTGRFNLDFAGNPGTGCSTVQICLGNGTTAVVLASSITANHWYKIDVQFDQVNSRARASIDGGAWSSYVTAAGGTFTSITNLRITSENPGQQGHYYFDDIGVGAGPTPSFSPWQIWAF